MSGLPTVAAIQQATAVHYGLSPAVMRENNGRGHDKAHPRQIAMTLAHRLTEHSLNRIGDFFGGRDHTTVIHAIRATERRRATDAQTHNALREITLQLVRG